MSWSYIERDPGIALFTACLNGGKPMVFSPDMRVLEIGCCEADWLHLAAAAWPECSFVGVDCRSPDGSEQNGRIERIHADALNRDLFPPESFDACVSLSAIEHFGLGHYGDPLNPDGDSIIITNILRWLKPGGWLYFDVPYDPTRYYLAGRNQTECRVYNTDALFERLMTKWHGQAYAPRYATARDAGTLVAPPTEPVEPFHYAAFVWTKSLTPQDSGQ